MPGVTPPTTGMRVYHVSTRGAFPPRYIGLVRSVTCASYVPTVNLSCKKMDKWHTKKDHYLSGGTLVGRQAQGGRAGE